MNDAPNHRGTWKKGADGTWLVTIPLREIGAGPLEGRRAQTMGQTCEVTARSGRKSYVTLGPLTGQLVRTRQGDLAVAEVQETGVSP